jgi:hypothetical protein
MENNDTSNPAPQDHGLTHYRTRTRWGPAGQPALVVPSRNGWPLAVAPAASRRVITIQGFASGTDGHVCLPVLRFQTPSSAQQRLTVAPIRPIVKQARSYPFVACRFRN